MNWSYLIKQWFGTLFLGTIILQLIMFQTIQNTKQICGVLAIFPISLLFGLIFSTPTYILYSFIYRFLRFKNINSNFAKIILILFVVFNVNITTNIIKGSMMNNITISYSLSAILSGLIFKLNFNNDYN
ncbi:hypothetical protein OX283_007635 [Flavobacterium sp. SUN052]|uniref:hypothetical protein n=1 Tax=Flavobacterium sp. SUN052 TaxID=3002441 RepID=UPI00237D9847|nr:hypothetical protein [Flavobacterium sp. SUN052]MEC4004524.1 hypothetical protein [Flavobacterium sp. SUN052]